MRETFLPFSLPCIGDEEIAEVVDSLRSGWITTGPKVQKFEDDFRQYVGCRHAVAVNSCTAALHVALSALGVGPGHEVIVPTLTFCSTANVVVHVGAKPVLVDVDEDLNIRPDAVEAAITARTRAVMPVHHGGQSCDLEAIQDIASRHQLLVVEDAAHAVGGEYRGRKIGSSSTVAAFSFYAIKNMTTGEGGMIATNDETLAARIRLLTLHGMSRNAWNRYAERGSWFYEVVEAGFKYNMTDIQAALGIHQLRRLDEFLEIRGRYARRYSEAFAQIPEIEVPVLRSDRRHTWHLYVIRLRTERLTIDRGQFIQELCRRNIGSSVHFIPVHLHPFYRDRFGYRAGDLPQAETLFERMISLPLYPAMARRDVEDVIDAVTDVVREHRR